VKKIFGGNANKGGVYQIQNLTNGKIYIGSAKFFKQRASQHQTRLNQGKHHNKHLLASWKKHGSNNFLFEVLEVVEGTTDERRKQEQKYIDQYLDNWDQCYNLAKKTRPEQITWSKNPEITKRKKSIILKKRWKDNEEFRKRMSGENHPFYGKPRLQEVKQSISEKAIGNKRFLGRRHTEETRKKMSATHKGKTISLEQRLQHSLKLTKRKLTKEHKKKISEGGKGRKQTEKQKLATSKANSKTYNIKLVSPIGEIFGPIDNASKFCRQYNLSPQKLYCVFSGKRPHHKGWKLLGPTNS